MKIVEETLRKLIEFSEKQQASRIRQLKAKGKSEKNATVDAYSSIIDQLSAVLPEKDNDSDS
jgi:hypothetical protein